MKKIFTLLFFICSITMFSQRTCGTMDKLHEKMNANPDFAIHHRDVMRYIQNTNYSQTLLNRNPNDVNTVITIPVVFHVLYKNAAQNISDAQINSQLDVLNKDYRKLNTDFSTVVPSIFQSVSADIEFVFVKAVRTPAGASTTGITRKSVPSTFVFETQYYTSSGELAWDPTQYLNIWVGRFSDSQLLGFAYGPSNAGNPDDGLCIGDQFFGTTGTASAPYNKGRTATHEIGHYFGLLHPWGEDNSICSSEFNSDGVSDTPPTKRWHYDCPTFPSNTYTCSNTSNGAMFMNYMDYVDDACMAFFTLGQKTVMRNSIVNSTSPRFSLLSSVGLGVNNFNINEHIAVYPNPVSQYFMITSPQLSIDEVELFNSLGQLVKTQKLVQTNNIINLEDLPSGAYYLRIYNEGKFLKSDKVIKK